MIILLKGVKHGKTHSKPEIHGQDIVSVSRVSS